MRDRGRNFTRHGKVTASPKHFPKKCLDKIIECNIVCNVMKACTIKSRESYGNSGEPVNEGKPMKRFQVALILFWMGLGLFATVYSYSLGLKGIAGPGPGLMPFLVGILLFVASAYLLASSFLRRQEEINREGQSHVQLWKVSLAVISLVAYALLVEKLGFLITTTLLLMVLLKGMGTKKWITVVMVSVLTSLITYFAFTYLRLRLPMGILNF